MRLQCHKNSKNWKTNVFLSVIFGPPPNMVKTVCWEKTCNNLSKNISEND